MAHKLSEPYSGKNPIPKVTTGLRTLISPQKATDAKAKQMEDMDTGTADQQRDEKQTESRTGQLEKGRAIRVRDPATGNDVEIRNAQEDHDTSNLGDNVLKLELPEPDWNEHRDVVVSTSTESIYILAASCFVSLIILALPVHVILRVPLALLPPAIATPTVINRIRNTAVQDADARAWHAERIRGLRAGDDRDRDGKVGGEERMRESAEWANAVLRGVWPILNPSLFDSLVDMIEDIMQSSVPSFVHSVRISDLGLGREPIRITSLRAIPDSENDDAMQTLGAEERDQLSGDHVNLEVSFTYRSMPSGSSAHSKAHNAHLLVDFFLGLKELYGFAVPVWTELQGVVGTARVRMQLIPDPPFVKTTLLTLLGLPRITISVVAMSRALPNVMNLPFVSGFISSALDTAAAEYVAPKSLILDMQQLMGGSDVKKDTEAVGVIVVHVHRATGIKSMDTSGTSDPYVTLTYSRLGKPLFSTRVIEGDLNPVFEETAVLLLDINIVKLQEKLSIQLWDSDRSSADDMMGFAEIDIIDLMRHKNEAHRRISHLISPDTSNRPGTVEYTAGYYAKMPPNESLKTAGHDPGIPEDLRASEEFKEARDTALSDLEAAVLVCPPDPHEYVSGVVGVQVHEIRDLGVGRGGRLGEKGGQGMGGKLKESIGLGGEEGQKGSDQAGVDEEGEGLPSSYCTISLNDELVYQTRVKPITSSPIFNAGTEKFVRDWRTAHVAVTVKDSRMRENDAILGVVYLKLSDLLVNSSQLTRTYHIEHGVGNGRIRISVLFRPVAAKLPPSLRGFDTGTIHVHDVRLTADGQQDLVRDLAKCEVKLKTTTTPTEERVPRSKAEANGAQITWRPERAVMLPVRDRYGAALVLAFKTHGPVSSDRAMAVLWLRDLVDRERKHLELPVWTESGHDFSRLRQNYVPATPEGDLSAWDSDREKLKRIGSVHLDLEFLPGVSDAHRKILTNDGAKAATKWEEADAVRSDGGRKDVGQVQVETPQKEEVREQNNWEAGEDSGGVHDPARQESMSSVAPTQHSTAAPDERDGESSTSRRPSSDTRHDSNIATDGHEETYQPNTMVSHDQAELEDVPSGSEGEDEGHESGSSDGDSEGDGHRKGPIKKLKKWKANQRELAREHRGVMQAKPARTAVWMKDNVKQGMHSMKDRFSMDSRQPDVETEV
ncbi:hypothetical protein FA95DRAFT_1555850 [Auriscalpium vulgare]|uniref:Uncharacterized protein n=1 Tax=Auriscalpium vulgare TaxID=40419 RepID=A0ACB8S2V9_9AGAM|nr:hypothetical protein FA95DRAFT_1555850 [Auriscalpium vulgare]